MTDLVADGQVVADDLTRAEVARLRDAGVEVPDPGDDQADPGGGGGSADGPDPDADPDGDGTGGAGGDDPADAEEAPDTDDSGAGDADGSENDHGPDDGPDQQAPDGDGDDGDTDGDAGDDAGPDGDGQDGQPDDAGDPTDGADGQPGDGPDDLPDDAPDTPDQNADMDGGDPGQEELGDGDDGDGADGDDPADAPDYTDDQTGDADDGGDPADPDQDPTDWDDLADEMDDLADDPSDGWDDPDPADDDPQDDAGGGGPDDGESGDLGGEQDAGGDPGDPADGGGQGPADDSADAPTGDGGGARDKPDDGPGMDPDDVDDAVRDMQDRSDARDTTARSGADQVDDDPDMWEDRLDRAKVDDGLTQARDRRDSRLRNGRTTDDADPRTPAWEVRRFMQNSGIAQDVRDRFEKIKKAPAPVNARRGSELDRKRLTRFRMGDPTASDFYIRQQGGREKARRAVGVALDLSGSMYGYDINGVRRRGGEDYTRRIDVSRVALAALAIACDEIGDTFTASGFQDTEQHHPDAGPAPLITGPNEQFEWDHLDTVTANHATPMGTGVIKGAKRLDRANMPEKTLFVVCDGKPTRPSALDHPDCVEARAKDGIEHTRRCVEEARNAGVGVMGVGIGDGIDEADMAAIFGHTEGGEVNYQGRGDPNFTTTDAGSLPEELAEVYERQLDQA